MRKFDAIIKWLEKMLICGAFLVMVAVTFAQVVARFVFHDPISWSEEIARFLFVWITMIGAAHAVAHGKHFSVDFLISRFSPAAQRKIGRGISVGVFVFAAIMVYFGAYVAWRTRFQISPALSIPMCYPYLCIPVSGLFTIIHLVAGFFPGGDVSVPPASEGGYAE